MHVGFLKSWLVGGFNEKVVSRIIEIANSRKPSSDKLQIYITGESPLVLLLCLKQQSMAAIAVKLHCRAISMLLFKACKPSHGVYCDSVCYKPCSSIHTVTRKCTLFFDPITLSACCLHLQARLQIVTVNGCPTPLVDKSHLHALGHSLGGALATLAAYDTRKQLQTCGKEDVEVMCYSFGAPRTGNHAFATDYNHMVPDTWSIINDQAGLAFSLHAIPLCAPVASVMTV